MTTAKQRKFCIFVCKICRDSLKNSRIYKKEAINSNKTFIQRQKTEEINYEKIFIKHYLLKKEIIKNMYTLKSEDTK